MFGHFLAQHTDLCKAQPVKRIEQEPAALGLGAGVQDGHQLAQRFHAAKVFLRRFAVDTYALGGNYVFVKLPAIPMPPLFMEQVLRFVIGPVKKFRAMILRTSFTFFDVTVMMEVML